MWLAALVVLILVLVWPTGSTRSRGRPPFRHTGGQWRRNYGRRAFLRLGLALGAAAVLAYSGADAELEAAHTRQLDPREGRAAAVREVLRAGGRADEADRLRAESFPASASDRVAAGVKPAGERDMVLVWGLAALGDWLWKSSAFSRWGRANFEAVCVGLPVLWTLQRGIGSDRPSVAGASPRWRPLRHAHGASGHAFIGAIPWWTLADRCRPGSARAAARGLGLLTGWSRLNDRKHYPSQILLGWTVAWNAVEAVRPAAEAGDPREAG
ncbi:MAG TPA: phosphatase PAP2 family protein [Candidatus Krumholzibacteria bacterium]|nr:phosphatase PAP2 family protein [Candidatus Krumholzibacteria bacterium]HPD72421.1 phosphatase PAP2 family protein [Candidatus Krumholzibacteria bacterium]HRY40647.1 phosphatase PAP2 family protein [Candidatus Krumholzibacteria bacterium]